MREIKFRAWNPMGRVMTGGLHINTLLLTCDLQDEVYKTIIWLQYTGLKDRNGKEIYEGDVVDILLRFSDCESFEMAVIEFKSGAFWFDAKRVGYVDCNWHHYNESDREVIGNIYSNPELLKDIKV